MPSTRHEQKPTHHHQIRPGVLFLNLLYSNRWLPNCFSLSKIRGKVTVHKWALLWGRYLLLAFIVRFAFGTCIAFKLHFPVWVVFIVHVCLFFFFFLVDYIVEYDYDAVHDDELTIRVGEIIRNVKKLEEEGWLEGELNGRRGMFPDNFVKVSFLHCFDFTVMVWLGHCYWNSWNI